MTLQINIKETLGELTTSEAKNAPDILFCEGDINLLLEGIRVSVVGSRNVSPSGIIRAQSLTRALVKHGITVVSGLAEGVDTIAHRTAIENGGKTIAVLGTPLSQVYPKSNTALLESIKTNHLAISQFPENYPFQKKNFPVRNRTMALISDATIIIEAKENSGTRHQGWEALRLGRIVYLLENVVQDKANTWAQEMLNYGAQILTRENLEDYLYAIPSLTGRKEVVF
ncbi:DNA-processing protein DprA [Xanthocytophaga agilis]|uniref:DNA-processing protein DprA n=1 Tax=Xanthocytophaga agilis TaxID=3048010 RepID=A0AAE3UIC2_9BACT|nr:DNA-processing protein DprA [Xanthocytophaga agilis]MDJ1505216.1 DNA-processing protein DprA [Xanthocytophaga agilis]